MLFKSALRVLQFGHSVLPKKQKKLKRSALKESLQIQSSPTDYTLSGQLNDPLLTITSLRIRDRSQETVLEVPNQLDDHRFTFQLSHSIVSQLSQHVAQMQEEADVPTVEEDGLAEIESVEADQDTLYPIDRFSLWLTFTKKVEHLTPEQLQKWESDGLPSHATLDASVFTREILLGRFLDTQIPAPLAPLMDETFNEFVQLYTDLKGNLRLLLNKEPQTKPKIQIDAVHNETKATTVISGKAFTRHAFIKTGRLLLVHRESGDQVPIPIDWLYQNEVSAKKFGLYLYHYTAKIHWSHLYQAAQLQEGVYDAFITLDFYHRSEPKLHRL
ncbi:MAG TPA: CDP-glycerol glycerophosphotransferase, partial [Exiguobacterium sp.]|nr:CDP-glycerol glycerophosphotransferase [Exiguobacterium sp.]